MDRFLGMKTRELVEIKRIIDTNFCGNTKALISYLSNSSAAIKEANGKILILEAKIDRARRALTCSDCHL